MQENNKKEFAQEELYAFVKKNDVAHDGKYLWGSFLSPLWGLSTFTSPPTAGAVGCILAPLRGWQKDYPLQEKLAIFD